MPTMKINGLPVIDANRPLIINITEKDIKVSKIGDEKHCAAATAICRQEKTSDVIVHASRAYVKSKNQKFYLRYMVPICLNIQTKVFDKRGKMDAGDYMLYAPQPSQKSSVPRPSAKRKARRDRIPSPRKPYHKYEGVRPMMLARGV